jgi:hypothetical protein
MMPVRGILDPAYLQWKACHLHGLAEAMSDSWYKKALHEIAKVYELLGDETANEESRIGECDGGGGYWYWTDRGSAGN